MRRSLGSLVGSREDEDTLADVMHSQPPDPDVWLGSVAPPSLRWRSTRHPQKLFSFLSLSSSILFLCDSNAVIDGWRTGSGRGAGLRQSHPAAPLSPSPSHCPGSLALGRESARVTAAENRESSSQGIATAQPHLIVFIFRTYHTSSDTQLAQAPINPPTTSPSTASQASSPSPYSPPSSSSGPSHTAPATASSYGTSYPTSTYSYSSSPSSSQSNTSHAPAACASSTPCAASPSAA